MAKKKNSKGVIAFLIVIIIILISVLGLSLMGIINLNDIINLPSNKELSSSKEDPSSEEKVEDDTIENIFDVIDINKLDDNGKDITDNYVESVFINRADSIEIDYDYEVIMTLSGKVKVRTTDENGNSYNNYISNVSDVVDIIHFSVPGIPEEQLIYMLLSNGDVYYYRVGDSINKDYNATKVDSVSSVKRLFIYNTTKKNAGGTWTLVAVTKDNKCVELKTESV